MTFHSGALRIAVLSFTLTLLAVSRTLAGTLPALPAAAESFDAGVLHVDRFGSGAQTLILIPGLGCGAWEWSSAIAHFSHQYTIYVVTLPGFNGYPATQKRPLFTAFAADFWRLLDTRNIQKPIVAGHSLGGTLAIGLGEEHADRLRAIVAVDGLPVFPALAGATPDQRAAAAKRLAATYAGMNAAQLLSSSQAYMTTIGTLDASLAGTTAQLEARSDANAMARWAQEDLEIDLRAQLPRLTIPLLEVMPYDASSSPYSQTQTEAFYRTLLAGAPNAKVVPVSPARHFAMLDQPDAFNAVLAGFVETAQGGSGL